MITISTDENVNNLLLPDKAGQLQLASQVPSDFHRVLHHDHVGI